MASYPDSIYEPRVKENRKGVEYDPTKKTVIFSEDIKKLDDEVVAIETALGLNLSILGQKGIVNVTVPNGVRAGVSGTISFSPAFSATPRVFLTMQDAGGVADAERPASTTVYLLSTSSFKIVIDCYINVSGERTVPVAWWAIPQ